MDNITALKSLCTAICSAFYADQNVLELALFNNGYQADADATTKDKALLKMAVRLVLGFVESSRSEGGISVGIDRAAIDDAIKAWCDEYDVEAEDVLGDKMSSIENASDFW